MRQSIFLFIFLTPIRSINIIFGLSPGMMLNEIVWSFLPFLWRLMNRKIVTSSAGIHGVSLGLEAGRHRYKWSFIITFCVAISNLKGTYDPNISSLICVGGWFTENNTQGRSPGWEGHQQTLDAESCCCLASCDSFIPYDQTCNSATRMYLHCNLSTVWVPCTSGIKDIHI